MTQEIFRTLLRQPGPGDWLQWLPLADWIMTDGVAAAQAFNGLSEDQRYDLLDRIREPSAGLFATIVLWQLAEHADEIDDAQVRLYVLEDAAGAADSVAARIDEMRRRVEVLRSRNGELSKRLDAAFDAAAEISRLRAEEARIRSEVCDREEFSEIQALEREILRLETRRRMLDRYDRKERERHRDALRSTIEEAESAKGPLEEQILAATAELNRLREEVAAREGERDTVRRDLDELEKRRATVGPQLAELQSMTANIGASLQDVSERALRSLAETCERLQKGLGAAGAELAQFHVRLNELANAARLAGREDLAAAIRGIYNELPIDEADRTVRGGRETGS